MTPDCQVYKVGNKRFVVVPIGTKPRLHWSGGRRYAREKLPDVLKRENAEERSHGRNG